MHYDAGRTVGASNGSLHDVPLSVMAWVGEGGGARIIMRGRGRVRGDLFLDHGQQVSDLPGRKIEDQKPESYLSAGWRIPS